MAHLTATDTAQYPQEMLHRGHSLPLEVRQDMTVRIQCEPDTTMPQHFTDDLHVDALG
jgi:hypothetical protein